MTDFARRRLLKTAAVGTGLGVVSISGVVALLTRRSDLEAVNSKVRVLPIDEAHIQSLGRALASSVPEQTEYLESLGFSSEAALSAVAYFRKMQLPDRIARDDVFLSDDHQRALASTFDRLTRIQRYFGHGFFNILGFEQLLKAALKTPSIGRFNLIEMNLLQWIFFENPERYGFRGEKMARDFLDNLRSSDLFFDARFGQYLFKRHAKPLFDRLRSDIGSDLILTSGARGLPKQSYLFLAKLIECQGNVSMASRSLAPPGYSYHWSGDFDVGSRRLGSENFSMAFTRSAVYQKMRRLNYVKLRYPDQNRSGVRFEPWHVKVPPF